MKQNIFRKAGAVLAAAAVLVLAGCSSKQEASAAKDPIVGQWTLSTVEMITSGEEGKMLNREENASFFENEANYYEFKEDGTVVHYVVEGGETIEIAGSWKANENGYSYIEGDMGPLQFAYNAETDTLHRVYTAASAEEAFDMIDFTYARKN